MTSLPLLLCNLPMVEVVTDKARMGLVFLSEVRLITIEQFARVTGWTKAYAGEWLHSHKLKKYLDNVGGIRLGGHGRAPKLYFITRKGWDYYTQEERLDLGDFINAKPGTLWSRGMDHRRATVDITLSLSQGVEHSGLGSMSGHRFDFRTAMWMGKRVSETQDYVSAVVSNRTRLIPDAAFRVTRSSGESALMFLETDLGTEQHTPMGGERDNSTATKLAKYEEYWRSARYQDRYKEWGDFPSFRVLVVTTTTQRMANMIEGSNKIADPTLHDLFRFSVHKAVHQKPAEAIWYSRDPNETKRHTLWD